MLRSVGKKINMTKIVEVEETVAAERIKVVTVFPDDRVLTIMMESMDTEGVVLTSTSLSVEAENYDLLMSDDAFFGEGKQEGSYREKDLWKMIDKVSEQ